jgi:hypothetical protein
LRFKDFTTAQGNTEARAISANAFDEVLFKHWNKPTLELNAISAENFKWHRGANMLVGQPVLLAIGLERKASARIKKTGGESFRLEVHAFGHVIDPHIHRPPEDPKVNSGRFEMSSDGKPVGARSNDRHVASFHIRILNELVISGDELQLQCPRAPL